MCARNTLVPKSLRIGLRADSMGIAQCRGGFGDVYKREHKGREVAVKMLRIYVNTDLRKLAHVSRNDPSNSNHLLKF